MNYKTEIPVYETDKHMTEQLTLLFDEDLYERVDNLSVELGLSMNALCRTLIDYGIKHCKIEVEKGDACKNCVHYMADDKDNHICTNQLSKYFASFRPSDCWCVQHKRRWK